MVPGISGNPLNKLKQNTEKAGIGVMKNAKNAGIGVTSKATNAVTSMTNQAKNAGKDMMKNAEQATNAVTSAKSLAEQKGTDMRKKVEQVKNEVASTTSKAENAGKGMMKNVEQAKNEVVSAKNLAEQKGTDMRNKVEQATYSVNQQVSNIGNKTGNAAKQIGLNKVNTARLPPNINELSVGKQFPNVPPNVPLNLSKNLPIDPKLGEQLKKFKKLEDLKNFKNLKPSINQALSFVKKNTQPKYAVETSNLIYSLGNGNPTKILFIMGIFLFGIVFIMADLISFNNIASNIVSYFILNLAFLTTLPKIIISVIGLLPGDFTSMTKLNEFIYFVSIYIISFFLNYKLYKLYITQKCAEEKIECNYTEEIVVQPFNYAFISTTITFSLMIIIKFIVKLVETTTAPHSPPNKGSGAFLRLYDYSELFKYGLIYNLIGTVIHTIVLYSIKSKMTVQPASY